MMPQKFSRFVVAVLFLVLAVVPVLGQDNTEIEPWVCPEGYEGQTLSIFNWATYIAETTIPDFEAACGVTIEYSIFENNEQALAVLRQGNPGYDLLMPSDYTVAIMIGEELLIPLNKELIPNIVNVSPQFLDLNFDPGNVYSLPYTWGTIGVGYSTAAFPDGINSWNDLFEYEGNVAWLEDPRMMLGVGLIMLGYDPNTTNVDEINEAAEYLIDNSDNVVAIAADDGQALLERGDVEAAIEYNGDVFQVIYDCECEDFAYSVPSEGAVVWTDSMVVPAGAPNPELAMVFIDYILHPQVNGDLANFVAYGSPNQAAIDLGLIDEELLNDPGIYPSEESQSNLFQVQELPEVEDDINDAWDTVKIEVG